jgi:hypothetical protein
MVTIELWLDRTVDNLPSTLFDLNEHVGLVSLRAWTSAWKLYARRAHGCFTSS